MSDPSALQVDIRPGFEHTWHIVERLCWTLMAMVVIAALSGLIGTGPLDSRILHAGGVTLSYERVVHYEAATRYVLNVPAGAPVSLHIDKAILQGMTVVHILPHPVSAAPDPSGYRYDFDGSGGEIRFELQPSRVGVIAGRVGVGGQSFSIQQYSLP